MTRVALCIVVLIFTKKLDGASWPFAISADGVPLARTSLVETKEPQLLIDIEIFHRLAFDGERYISRYEIPLLSSKLFPLETKERYLWQDLHGDVRQCFVNKTLNGVSLKVYGDEAEVQFRGARFFYKTCRLKKIINGNSVYDFSYAADSELVKITRMAPSVETIVECRYSEDGSLESMSVRGRELQFGSDSHQVDSCLMSGAKIWSASRDRGLLRSWHDRHGTAIFEWSTQAKRQFTQSKLPLMPLISKCNDLVFSYEFSYRGLKVHFKDLRDTTVAGFWSLSNDGRMLEVFGQPVDTLRGRQ